MIETTQSLSRVIALIATTALFAGVWTNDQPVGVVALKSQPLPHNLVQLEPEWVPMVESDVSMAKSISKSSSIPEVRTISLSQRSKNFAVESGGLLIAEGILQSHLDQLPVGLPVGDYRIVDSLGGVGWLRVRMEGSEIAVAGDRRMLSTTVDDETVRFIQVGQTALGHASDSIIR